MRSSCLRSWGDDVEGIETEIAALIGTSTHVTLVANMLDARGAAALAGGRLGDATIEYRKVAELNAAWTRNPDQRMLAAHASFWGGDTAGAAIELEAIVAAGFRAPTVEAREKPTIAALLGRRGWPAGRVAGPVPGCPASLA